MAAASQLCNSLKLNQLTPSVDQLGELNEWSKKTNTELAVHVPLIIRVPWKTNSMGKRTAVKAELVDLYRTLVDLAGFNQSDVQPDVQGTSLAPVFEDPTSPPAHLNDKVSFAQIGRCACQFWPQYNATECDANACCRVRVEMVLVL